MVLIVGLGNPGKQYELSRHNLGFRVVERVAVLIGLRGWKTQSGSLVAKGSYQGRPVLLAKPQTFMNNSGRAVSALLHYYRIPLADCLVVVDDLDLEPGKIRQRLDGSDGGHRGLRSIIETAGNRDFKRLRIGIGRPGGKHGVVSYVLGRDKEQEEVLDEAVEEAARRVLAFLETGQFENWSSS